MNGRHPIDEPIELERYELSAEPAYRFDFEFHRRDFFRMLGGGLVLVFTLDALASQESGRQQGESGRGAQGGPTPKDIAGWLHIGEDGPVTVFTEKSSSGRTFAPRFLKS